MTEGTGIKNTVGDVSSRQETGHLVYQERRRGWWGGGVGWM